MTIQRMIDLLKIELQCVTRKARTNCYGCELCDLVQDDAELQNMYCSVIEALEAQIPHVMTLEEVKECDYCWFETKGWPDRDWFLPVLWIPSDNEDEILCFTNGRNCDYECGTDTYNIDWRCWSSLPDEEQRKAAAWHEA